MCGRFSLSSNLEELKNEFSNEISGNFPISSTNSMSFDINSKGNVKSFYYSFNDILPE